MSKNEMKIVKVNLLNLRDVLRNAKFNNSFHIK